MTSPASWRRSLKFKTQVGAWDSYVASHLLNRIFGFELLMAPYAVAHLKIGMQLEQTGYHFGSDQRLGIYLTNTLEEAMKKSEKLFEKWISDEANEAAAIKRDKQILVVVGNPPYSGHSANRSRDEDGNLTFIGKLIEDYKILDGRRMKERVLKWLHDDYVKFIRFAQWRLDRTGEGIIGYISNNAWLDNPTFPGMRQALLDTFSELWVYNLHGSTRKKERTPSGGEDKNVFDIQQGVAIFIGVKEKGHTKPATVHYADLWGTREKKYETLLDSQVVDTPWLDLRPHSPSYLLVPEDTEFAPEYEKAWPMPAIMPVNSVGIATARDHFTIHWTKESVWRTVTDFVKRTPEDARGHYKLRKDVRDWKVRLAQADLKGASKQNVIPVLYRPFDVRYTYYTGRSRGFHCMPRGPVMRHLLAGDNFAIITSKLTKGETFRHVQVTDIVAEVICMTSKTSNNGFVFPLYLYPAKDGLLTDDGHRPNFSPDFLKTLAAGFRVKTAADGLPDGVTPEEIAGYIYAILHSPIYRSRYASLLARHFPRIPITTSRVLFDALAAIGQDLIAIQLLGSATLSKLKTTFAVVGTNTVEGVTFDPSQARVWINGTQYFGNVPIDVWTFFVGGYRVAEKWLKDRKGRKLTYDEIQRYQRIIAALQQTMRLMASVDAAVAEHGGWPIKCVTPSAGRTGAE